MNEDYLYSVIGRLYVEGNSLQKLIPQFQTALAQKDKELGELRDMLSKATVVMDQEPQWTTPNAND